MRLNIQNPLTPDGVRQTAVETSDLNLQSPAGLNALNGRLRVAANLVCGPQPAVPTELAREAAYRSCVHQAVSHALNGLGAREAAATHQANYR